MKRKERKFLGQPWGLSTLFFTEMWERFSYHGMRAILLFYMYYQVTQGGLGLEKGTASSIMAIYGSLVYLAAVLGGWVGDRLLGSFKTVLYGGVLIMLGHIVLSFPSGAWALFVSIALIVVGTGFLKPNVSDMVGLLYSEEDQNRDVGFTIFVFGINFGSFIAPIVVGSIGQGYSFHVGFSLAAIGMLFGLIQYYRGRNHLSAAAKKPSNPITPTERQKILRLIALGMGSLAIILVVLAGMGKLTIDAIILLITIIAVALPFYYFTVMLTSKKVTAKEKKHVLAYIPLFIAIVLFWGIQESGSVVMTLFAEDRTILHIGALQLHSSNFQALNPFFITILMPGFTWLIQHWKRQPSSAGKFAIGLILAGCSYLLMTLPGLLHGTAGRVSPFWLIASALVVEIAECFISPIGLSTTTKLAPAAFRSQMMSMWFLADAVGQAFNSQLVSYYSPTTEISYFFAIGSVSVIAGFILVLFVPRIKQLMHGLAEVTAED
ncbi:peptide MFS transporter [Loigolactobacillus rennini]|uniref:DtpT protein n=1 Tax=Loigolactobacillus rennini DSM 20253 TaxID=1423796 RepID=A0A0R2DGA4_9LACO|nr:oligopeptide:H+ symporter [Loigolactobacillus rennini]KRM99435.1 dtpT protein [Loigolactobacillus rennini DSM 20253]